MLKRKARPVRSVSSRRARRAGSVSVRPAVLAAGLLSMFAFSAACLYFAARGQDGPAVQTSTDAPPMQYIPPEDRARLAAEADLKERTLLSIQIAETHLANSERHAAASHHAAAASELGIYQAVVADALSFLHKYDGDSGAKVPNKIRDLYKRIELALRAHGPRLETIRRATPSEEAASVRAVYEFTRRARSEALNSFYGETVVREGTSQKEKATTADEAGKGAPPQPPSPY